MQMSPHYKKLKIQRTPVEVFNLMPDRSAINAMLSIATIILIVGLGGGTLLNILLP